MIALSFGPSPPDHRALRERIEAEVRQAERLRIDADELARRLWAEARATEDHVRHIRWLGDEPGGKGDRDRRE